MNRLQTETRRLYLTERSPGAEAACEPPGLTDPEGRVRAMVLGLNRPADWAVLSKAWQGVQADLGLPAPAIAVGGEAGLQLWFSLDQPVPAGEARAFVEALRRRYLADTAAARVALWPQADASAPAGWRHAEPVPAPLPGGERWSAFVAQDLAAVFAEEPWLDLPPSVDGQAQLLARLENIRPEDFSAALALLEPVAVAGSAPVPVRTASALAETAAGGTTAGTAHTGAADAPAFAIAIPAAADDAGAGAGPGATTTLDPHHFLLRVMNDETVAMALRIKAAKALLAVAPASTPLKD